MALATRGGFPVGAEGSLGGSSIQSRGGGSGSFAQKSGLLHSTGSRSSGGPALTRGKFGLRHAQTVSAALLELETRSTLTVPSGKTLPRHGPTLLEVTHARIKTTHNTTRIIEHSHSLRACSHLPSTPSLTPMRPSTCRPPTWYVRLHHASASAHARCAGRPPGP